MSAKARRLTSAVHVHQKDPDTGAVVQTVVVENRTLRRALREHDWLQAALDDPASAHVWEDIPDSDEDDEPFVTDAGNSGGRVKQPSPASGGRSATKAKADEGAVVSAFAPGIEDLDLDGDSAGIAGDATSDDAVSDRPARSGSKADWLAYAEANGVTVGEDAKRDDIIEAVERAGL